MVSKAKVAILKCNSYSPNLLKGAVVKLLHLLDFDYNQKWKNTLINPNMLSAKGPERAITTHPNLVRTVADLFSSDSANVLVGDSPGGADRGIKRVWKNTGLLDAIQGAQANLYSFEGNPVTSARFNGREFWIADIRSKSDLVIGLPKLKTHVLTLMTGALKNCFGFIPGFRKSVYHKEFPKPYEFSEMLAHLYAATKPDLFIMDAILSMEGDGPSSGKPKSLNLLMASTDAVALDTVASTIIGFNPMQIDYLRIAKEMGIGCADIDHIGIRGEKLENCRVHSFQLPSNTKLKVIPDFLIKMIRPYVWAHPAINYDTCIKCNICKNNCPMQAISNENGRLIYDYSKCIDCMCCHELCPNQSIFLNKSWLVKKFIK